MKLVRYGRPGKEKPGLIDEEGKLRDLSGVIADIDGAQLSDKALRKLAKLDEKDLAPGARQSSLRRAAGESRQIHRHRPQLRRSRSRVRMPIPAEPIVFMKAITCLNGPDDNVVLPKGAKKTDWEVELGVIIGTRAQYVSEEDALKYVAGYCVVNDISERSFQLERGGQWDKGKGCDTFGPIGPWLVTRDEVIDEQDLDLYLEVNGKRMQTGNTQTMIFTVAQIVSYLSQFMTLEPGDVIATGTPPGVGQGRKPQRFLKKGDSMRLGIPGLGEQQQDVVAWTA